MVGKITPSLRPQLLVAGPRNCNYKPLHQLAKKLGVKLKTITGQTPTQMANHYQASKATLATAYLEPFGLSVIESLACSTPVVAVDEGGFRETILNHKTGLLLPRNISIFAQELEQLLSNPKRLQELAGNGPQKAMQFTWTKTAQKINKIIHHVVSK